MTEFYLRKGIMHQRTCIETPKQNVVVERKHQHILNIERALKCQSGLSLKYWNDFVLTVVYFINRTPIPILDHQAPLKYCSKPNYTQLKAFGFLAFATTLANGRHKFDSRSRKYVFTGYPFGTMGTYC